MNSMRQRVRFYSLCGAAAFVIGLLLFQPDTAVGQVTGSGTINKIPKWTATTTLTDSAVTEVNGNVGIGTTSPAALLHLRTGTGGEVLRVDNGGNAGWIRFDSGGTPKGYVGFGDDNSLLHPALTQSLTIRAENALHLGVSGTTTMTLVGGNVGIGTTGPNRLLHIRDTAAGVFTGARVSVQVDSSDPVYELLHETANKGFRWRLGNGGVSDLYLDYTTNGFASYAPYLSVLNSGKVGIGTTSPQKTLDVAGDVNASGTISGGNVIAKYQDVAEWVPASRAIPAGTVVSLDPEHSNHVLPSTRSYDTRVAGVISASPGVLLGEGGAGRVMVATTGRVRVKVDATNGPIRVGDLLVTSDKEGIAMRSQPLDLGGTPIHRPGTLIGKALEPLEKGVGEILVLLSLQ